MLERIKDMLFTSQWYHNEDFFRLKMVTGIKGREQGIAPTMDGAVPDRASTRDRHYYGLKMVTAYETVSWIVLFYVW
jgi:hypothetical protein